MYALAFALIIAFNPAAISQLLTDYVDRTVSAVLSLIMLCLFNIELTENKYAKWNWFVMGSALILVANLKFTGLFIAVIMMGVFPLYWWWKKEPAQ